MNIKRKAPSAKYALSKYMVPAVDRAVSILMMLAGSDRGMTLAEIASATGWHKSSVHKILITLDHHGFLDRDETTKRYTIGIELIRCGQAFLNRMLTNRSAKSLLRELADFSGETATLAILRETKIVILDVVESPGEIRVSPPIGTMDPATTKSNGKAVLAWLPEERVNGILETEGLPEKTRNSITDVKLYRKDLAAIRKRGYAVDIEEFQEGISAVSAPVFNSEGQVFGALSIIGFAFRMTKEKLHLYGEKCAETAGRLLPLTR